MFLFFALLSINLLIYLNKLSVFVFVLLIHNNITFITTNILNVAIGGGGERKRQRERGKGVGVRRISLYIIN